MQVASGKTVESLNELPYVNSIYEDSAKGTDYVAYLDTKFFGTQKRSEIENLGVTVDVVDSNCNYGKLRLHLTK
jgi:hypothetical protein